MSLQFIRDNKQMSGWLLFDTDDQIMLDTTANTERKFRGRCSARLVVTHLRPLFWPAWEFAPI
jgi:hypothetical protein